jgi:hypothetical protein
MNSKEFTLERSKRIVESLRVALKGITDGKYVKLESELTYWILVAYSLMDDIAFEDLESLVNAKAVILPQGSPDWLLSAFGAGSIAQSILGEIVIENLNTLSKEVVIHVK